jgi:eukaryotic-like serine/threonine-protein kinase
MSLQPSNLSDFRMEGALGSGATSRVLEAVHIASGRKVAIKLLDPPEEELATELRERFAREAWVLSSVASRHIGRILGFGFELGQPFLVLEHLDGETLDARVKREGAVSLAVMRPWIAQLIMAVRDFHALGIIHRDLKPANIFLQRTGTESIVKVIDFGLARSSEANGALTNSQQVLGSVGYMAPEQFIDAQSVGPSADVYAVGSVIFRCLTGQLPFMSRSIDAVIRLKLERDPPLLSSTDRGPKIRSLDGFVARAMAKDPGTRFQSAKEMLDAWWSLGASLDTSDQTSSSLKQVDDPFGTGESKSLLTTAAASTASASRSRLSEGDRISPPPLSPINRSPHAPASPRGLRIAPPPPLARPVTTNLGGAGDRTNRNDGGLGQAVVSHDPTALPDVDPVEVDLSMQVSSSELESDDVPTIRSTELLSLVQKELALARNRKT